MDMKSVLKLPINGCIIVMCLISMTFFGNASLTVAVSILALFLLNRDSRVLHPTNMLFLFSALYLILPVTIFYLFELVSWEYILPWGMVSDWSAVTHDSMRLVLMAFCIPFFSMIYLTNSTRRDIGDYRDKDAYISLNICMCFLMSLIVGISLFVYMTGGIVGWITDYSNVYISGKTGVGWLNFILINLSHFTFFICGFTLFSSYPIGKSRKYLFFTLLLIAFVMVCYVQGLKSRVPILAIMFFSPLLLRANISLKRGIFAVLFFISFFMFAMYFRSNGFYSTVPIAIEYLLSYFNTYILLDSTMQDFAPDYFRTIWFSSTKFTSIAGLTPIAEYLDISYWLTDLYFPEAWARSATQQWPLEMELYFNYGGVYFSFIPLLIMSLYYSMLFNTVNKGNHYVCFIFISEFIRLFSILRGSMFPWTLPLVLIFYMLTYIFMKLAVRRPSTSNL